jgi:hypothetical protein
MSFHAQRDVLLVNSAVSNTPQRLVKTIPTALLCASRWQGAGRNLHRFIYSGSHSSEDRPWYRLRGSSWTSGN